MGAGIAGLAEFNLENPAMFCLVRQKQKAQPDAKSDWAETTEMKLLY
jgi:hypothetical protein